MNILNNGIRMSFQNFRHMKANTKKEKSIFRTILAAMLLVLGIEILLLVAALGISHVSTQLNQNAVDILEKQVDNRQSYLENLLTANEELSSLAERINNTAQELVDSGQIRIGDIEKNKEDYLLLMKSISERMLNNMRRKSVTGIYVAFNTEDLDQRSPEDTIPALYIRDLDPDSLPPEKNTDLLMERSPVELVKSMGISTDKGWKSQMFVSDESTQKIIYPVFQEAFKDQGRLDAADYGHWTTEDYILDGDNRSAIAYSIPLILSDGTVYGVLGTEMLTEYLKVQMPYEELQNQSAGIYILAYTKSSLKNDEIVLEGVCGVSGENSSMEKELQSEKLKLKKNQYGDYQLKLNEKKYYMTLKPLQLYNRNAPFFDEQWILIGAVDTGQLFSFSWHVIKMLAMTVFLTVLVGVLSSLVISLRLARPVRKLSGEVEAVQKNNSTSLQFSDTGIRELDQFADAIIQMNQDMITISTKFLRIMEMASVELGGFEVRMDNESVYVTDNFFSMLGVEESSEKPVTGKQFVEFLKNFDRSCSYTVGSDGAKVYCVEHAGGEIRYVRMEIKTESDRRIGLVEDVTKVTRERMNIEHERDYDTLTGLYNRRAFQWESEALFREHPEKLKTAAFVMIDMDNLKYTNDNFGHDFGDRYIHEAGRGFAEYVPEGTLCSRISGDEFNLLFYGYDSKEEIRNVIAEVKAAIDRKFVLLPSGRKLRLSISGGIAWYPENSTDLKLLKKYADFAMYQVKRSGKGHFQEFDLEVYDRSANETEKRKQFLQLIRKEELTYYYQPIVSAITGKVLALEALMRVEIPLLRSPEDVLRLAKEERCLHELERITFFRAAEGYCILRDNGEVRGDELLFINSIASQNLTDEESREFRLKYGELQSQLVIEITEQETLDQEAMEKKNAPEFWGAIALDDYGTGYNSEKCLLTLSPQYVKVDIAIIRDIDTDADKQQIVSNIVEYAHQRGMYIIAEGVETKEELEKVLELKVDLLQGYYLARPAAVPQEVNPDAVKIIREKSREI